MNMNVFIQEKKGIWKNRLQNGDHIFSTKKSYIPFFHELILQMENPRSTHYKFHINLPVPNEY